MKRLLGIVSAAFLAMPCAVGAAPAVAGPLVSRAEAVRAVVESSSMLSSRAEYFRSHVPPLPLFDDVPQQNGLVPVLEAAFEQGIITGNAARTFRPTDPVTVEELTVIHARAVAMHDADAAAALLHDDGTPLFLRAQRVLVAHGMDVPKNLGTNAKAQRTSFTHMRQQLSFSMLTNESVTLPQEQTSSAVTTVSQVPPAAPASSSGVPQFLPIRLNPLPSPQTAPARDEAGSVHAVVATAQIVQEQPDARVAYARDVPAGYIDAGSSVSTAVSPAGAGISFVDAVGSGQGTVIDAGGGDFTASDTFTITIPTLGIGPITVSSPEDPFSHNGLLAPLQQGLGHLFGNPGGGGKILVYGHSSSYPWDTSAYTKIFRRINELNPGDEVIISYGGQEYRYTVTFEETVPAKDMSAYQDDGNGEDLILYTCWPPDSISQRYLVHAKPV